MDKETTEIMAPVETPKDEAFAPTKEDWDALKGDVGQIADIKRALDERMINEDEYAALLAELPEEEPEAPDFAKTVSAEMEKAKGDQRWTDQRVEELIERGYPKGVAISAAYKELIKNELKDDFEGEIKPLRESQAARDAIATTYGDIMASPHLATKDQVTAAASARWAREQGLLDKLSPEETYLVYQTRHGLLGNEEGGESGPGVDDLYSGGGRRESPEIPEELNDPEARAFWKRSGEVLGRTTSLEDYAAI